MASLLPELQLRTPTTLRPKDGLSNSGGRTATWSRRDCISQAVCPSSTSAAPTVSAENHRLAVNTANNVLGWENRVLALAKVMESYCDSFRALARRTTTPRLQRHVPGRSDAQRPRVAVALPEDNAARRDVPLQPELEVRRPRSELRELLSPGAAHHLDSPPRA